MAYMGKGLGAIKEAAENSMSLLKLKSGESKVIRVLIPDEEIISVYEHTEQFSGRWKTVTCLGQADCPLCKAGRQAIFRSYIPVLDRDDGDRVKIFKASKTVGVQLSGLVDEYGPLRNRDYKILRNGDRFNTTYQFFPKDPTPVDFDKYDIPNIEEIVKPLSVEEIQNLMHGAEFTVETASDSAASGSDDGFPF